MSNKIPLSPTSQQQIGGGGGANYSSHTHHSATGTNNTATNPLMLQQHQANLYQQQRFLDVQTVLRGRRDAQEGFVVGEKGIRNPPRPLTRDDVEAMDSMTELVQRCCEVGAAVPMDDANERPQSVFRVVSRKQAKQAIDWQQSQQQQQQQSQQQQQPNAPPAAAALINDGNKHLRTERWRWCLHRFQHSCYKCGGQTVDFVLVVTTHTNTSSPRVVALLFADGFPCNGTMHTSRESLRQLRQQEIVLLEQQEKIATLVSHVDMFASFDVVRLRDDVVAPFWEQLLVGRGLRMQSPFGASSLVAENVARINNEQIAQFQLQKEEQQQLQQNHNTDPESPTAIAPPPAAHSANINSNSKTTFGTSTSSHPASTSTATSVRGGVANNNNFQPPQQQTKEGEQHQQQQQQQQQTLHAKIVKDSINALHIALSYRSVVILGSIGAKRFVRGWLEFFRAIYDADRVVLPEPVFIPSAPGSGGSNSGAHFSAAASSVGGGGNNNSVRHLGGGGDLNSNNTAQSDWVSSPATAAGAGGFLAPPGSGTTAGTAPQFPPVSSASMAGNNNYNNYNTNSNNNQHAVCFVTLFGQRRFSWLPFPNVAAQAFYANNVEADLLHSLRRLIEEDFDVDPLHLPCVCTVDEATGRLFVPASQLASDQTAVFCETAESSRLMNVLGAILDDVVAEQALRQLIQSGGRKQQQQLRQQQLQQQQMQLSGGGALGGESTFLFGGGPAAHSMASLGAASDESNLTVASTSLRAQQLGVRASCESILFRSAFFWANWCRRYSHEPKQWDLPFVGLAADRDAAHWLRRKTVAIIESQLRL